MDEIPDELQDRFQVLGGDPRDLAQYVSAPGRGVLPSELPEPVSSRESGVRSGVPAIISAPELMRKQFPEPRWAVPGLFAEGLTLLVGAPKLGKSWLALNVGVAISHGGHAVGTIPVDAGDVLLLSLEDTERRLQGRLRTTLGSLTPSCRLDLVTQWSTMHEGGIEDLDVWLTDHVDARLVVIDTFQRFRGPIPNSQNLYAADYSAAGTLKQLADRHSVAVVVVHHTRKNVAEDPLDTVSGTNGLAGAADTICVLRREIGRADAALYIRGRDVAETDHALSFDPTTCAWRMLGDASEYRQSKERQDIVDLLRTAREPMAPKDIAEALGKKREAVRYLLSQMLKAGDADNVGGAYRFPIPNSPNTPNAPPDIKAPVRAVSGVRDTHSAAVPDALDTTPGLFGSDLLLVGVCEVCGDATKGQSLCWSCR